MTALRIKCYANLCNLGLWWSICAWSSLFQSLCARVSGALHSIIIFIRLID